MQATDDHRIIYRLLVTEHPNGLTREELAEHSGFNDRKCRKLLEDLRIIAANKPHPRHGPIVLGYDPELHVYTFGKDKTQRDRMLKYYAARLSPIATALAAQRKAAEHHDRQTEPTVQDALFAAGQALDTRYVQ